MKKNLFFQCMLSGVLTYLVFFVLMSVPLAFWVAGNYWVLNTPTTLILEFVKESSVITAFIVIVPGVTGALQPLKEQEDIRRMGRIRDWVL